MFSELDQMNNINVIISCVTQQKSLVAPLPPPHSDGHYDWFEADEMEKLEMKSNRIATVLIYLSGEKGGEWRGSWRVQCLRTWL